MWGVQGLGALPRPTARPWGVRLGPAPHWLWVRGVWAWQPATNPTTRTLVCRICALWGRHEGARGGGCLLPGFGTSAVWRFPTPDRPSFGRAAGARYPLALGAGGVGAGTRHQPHSAHSCQLALPAVGAARGRWGGGCLLPRCGASGVGHSPTPESPSLGHAAGAGYPLAVGAGGVGLGTCHQPRSTRSADLALRAVGAAGGRPGGMPLAWVWGVRGWALSHARPPVLRACGRGPLPTGSGCGGCGQGDLSPIPQRALLLAGFARCGGGTRAPEGGCLLPGCGASGVGRSPTPNSPSFGHAAGARYPLAVCAGGVGVETRHQPLSAGSCKLGLRVVGPAEGRPGRMPLAWMWGVWGWALSHLRPPVPQQCGRGLLPTGCGCGGCWPGDLSPTPQRALCRAGFARCGGGTRAPEGGCPLPRFGASGVGRSPTPNSPSLRRAAGARYPLAVGAGDGGVETRHQSHSAGSCELGLRVVGPAQGRPGRMPLAWMWGIWGWALSHARPPVPQECGRGPLPTGCGCGGCGPGDLSPTPQRALCRARFARCGCGTRAPEGGCPLPRFGASGVGRSPTPNSPFLGRAAGARYPLAVGAGGGGVETRHQPHSAGSCELGLCVVGPAQGRPRGVASCLDVGRPGLGALPRPTARPSGVRPGPATH